MKRRTRRTPRGLDVPSELLERRARPGRAGVAGLQRQRQSPDMSLVGQSRREGKETGIQEGNRDATSMGAGSPSWYFLVLCPEQRE
jgi:hypothetical protein